jgi:hypothetical protein
MSGFRVVTTTKTFCRECGRELQSADDWSRCRRRHHLEHIASTEDGRRILEMLRGAGFKDEPDPHLQIR